VEAICSAQAGKDVHAGYDEQWIKALEAGIDIIPNPLNGPLLARKIAQCSLLTLDAFYLVGDEDVSPGKALKQCNTQICEDDEPNTAPAHEAMILGGDGGALRRPKILRFLQFP
jgi:hypothetical protein